MTTSTASPLSPVAPSVEIRGITRRFGEVAAVDDVSLSIGHGEFFALLGPSGCGKTTLLRMIAGLETPTAGTILIDGADVTRMPPDERPANMVFQQYALFPHLTVAENVAFGLRYRGLPKRAWAAKVAEALALVRLAGLEARRPDQLSGGQRQRVALARALVLEPKVLLLDEPLAALDRKLRKEVQVELKTLQRTLGITFLFVTHDQEEALAMSDRIAVMSQGRVAQVGSPAEIFERPETELVAEFMGAANFFTAEAREAGPGLLGLRLASGTEITVPAPARGTFRPGDAVRFTVRPEKLVLRSSVPSEKDVAAVPVTLEDCVYQGINTLWMARGAGGERFVVSQQNGAPVTGLPEASAGTAAFLCWNPAHTVVVR
ncbi:MAG TPA: ABC transporter ATP-binding protein [Thermoanaerobaculia bacterium]|jgi:spermidine/putrescine ABC transporter ATP-binding subunit|nr:ABC transporter ATP-binding protein [Thermoanaerobaculia bacterium]